MSIDLDLATGLPTITMLRLVREGLGVSIRARLCPPSRFRGIYFPFPKAQHGFQRRASLGSNSANYASSPAG